MCYSDAHCALSDKTNKCEFTIPGVFGYCVCDSAVSQTGCPSKGQQSSPVKPNSSAFKYPFSRPDTKKKPPYQKHPWQTANSPRHTTTTAPTSTAYTTTTTTSTTTSTTSTTTTAKPFKPAGNFPQSLPFRRPLVKPNVTGGGGAKAPAVPATTLRPPQPSSAPTPSPIKIYLKSPPKDVPNKSPTTTENDEPAKPQKKPTGSSAGKFDSR